MNQIKTLKLNVTNIKSTLIRGNKELKKLRSDEKSFFLSQQNQEKRIGKENFLEGKSSGSGIVGGIVGKMLAPAMSIFDSIKEFIGTVLLGIIVNNLPSIISGVQQFLDKNKWIIDTLKTVLKITGDLFLVLIDIVNFFNPKKSEMEKERKEFEKKLSVFFGEVNEAEKDLEEAEKSASEFVNYTINDKDEIKQNVVSAISQSRTPITRQQFVTTANQYTRAKTSGGITPEIVIPGIGTYQRIPDPKSFLGMGTIEMVTDETGMTIDPKEFDRRFNVMIGSQNEIFGSLKSKGVRGYAKGGFVENTQGSSSRPARQGETGGEKISKRGMNIFSDLRETVEQNSQILDVKESTQTTLQELVSNFQTYLDLTRDKKVDQESPYQLPETQPGQNPYQGPVIPTPSGLPAITVNPKQIIGTVGYTGYTVPKGPGGSHIHIQNVRDYKKGIPLSVKNSIFVSGRPMTQQLNYTSGIGWRWGKMHKGEDYAGSPDQPITLTGGLKFKQFIPDQGDGYGNRVIIEAPDGGIYSLNHLNAGPKNLSELLSTQNNQGQGKNVSNGVRPISPAQVIPLPPGLRLEPVNISPSKNNKKAGGKGGIDMLTQYFDGDGMTDVIIINSVQPIIVPR